MLAEAQGRSRAERTRTEKITRLFCLVTALLGVIVTAIPIVFPLVPYYVPLILVGTGVAVFALAVFLYLSI